MRTGGLAHTVSECGPTVADMDEERMREDTGQVSADYAPRVEIGWLVLDEAGQGLEEVVAKAAEQVRRTLEKDLPSFDWRTSVVSASVAPRPGAADPILLLDVAERERDARGWDFVLVVTAGQIAGFELRRPRAVPSALLSTAIISAQAVEEARGNPLEERLAGISLHLFGRLNNLVAGRGSVIMQDADAAMAASGASFSEDELAKLRDSLDAVSDLRVEEMAGAGPPSFAGFYLRSIQRNMRVLPRQILRMHPWSFPVRLSRLTTAAGSALLVLMMTAKSWEVAANLSALSLGILAIVAIFATSAYLVRAQQLLAREGGALREQRAVRNVGTALAVLLGMTITYVAAFAVVLGLGAGLFGTELLERWADGAPVWPLRFAMAGFAASLSLAIGALGASFERYGYFRHVTHVDEEI